MSTDNPQQIDNAIEPDATVADVVHVAGGRLLRTQGVTAPAGFRGAGIAAGIKKSGKSDLALVLNEGPRSGRCRRLHPEQGQGSSGALVSAGPDDGQAARGGAQLGRRERLHGRGWIPGCTQDCRGSCFGTE